MKIFITGHTGFIGQFLTKKLTEKSHAVVGLDLKPPSEEQARICQSFTGSILSREDLSKSVRGADLIISLAAEHHDFGVKREDFFKVNVEGTELLLDVAAKEGINKLIFYSSVAVYGNQKNPTDENILPAPSNPYGASKLDAEKVIDKWVVADGKRSVIIIRPTAIFGPKNLANMYNLIDKIYWKKFIFVGKGENIKSVAYVENLVDATVFLIDKLKPGIQIYNYSDEPQFTIAQTVDIISGYMPHRMPKIKIPLFVAVSFGSIFDLLAKITGHNFPITGARMKKFATSTHHKADKIRQLGFKQNVELKEGFKRMVEWYLARTH
jgi:nucleoside-diphosphate-sugar epimerase